MEPLQPLALEAVDAVVERNAQVAQIGSEDEGRGAAVNGHGPFFGVENKAVHAVVGQVATGVMRVAGVGDTLR